MQEIVLHYCLPYFTIITCSTNSLLLKLMLDGMLSFLPFCGNTFLVKLSFFVLQNFVTDGSMNNSLSPILKNVKKNLSASLAACEVDLSANSLSSISSTEKVHFYGGVFAFPIRI